jgi:hypothetical protein
MRVLNEKDVCYHVPPGLACRVLVATAGDLLRQVQAAHTLRTVKVDGVYQQARGWEQPTARSLRADLRAAHTRAVGVAADLPGAAAQAHRLIDGLSPVLDPSADLASVWAAFAGAAQSLASHLPVAAGPGTWAGVRAGSGGLEFELPAESTAGNRDRLVSDEEFLRFVQRTARERRHTGQHPSLTQLLAEQVAYTLLSRGHHIPGGYRTWGTSGFRAHQTYMSVTDPGIGHLDGTVRDLAHLDGVIVHIEHLERAGHPGRGTVEPYRIPFPQVVPQIRLLLGDDAPSSSYVGRPVFENGVSAGLLKTVHTVAAACSELFAQGLTECKIAIEGMTTTQAVHYMRALRAAIRRDPSRQVLSAAFNLNTSLVDDRPVPATPPPPDAEAARFATGLLGIELTYAGGFDKVTWDGTADTYPSRCVLEQITPVHALTLVHSAHELGLLTYFSAGFRFEHLVDAVETGVDGVGVGGAQILRYMDKETGHHGPFLPGNIGKILHVRDTSEQTVRGRAATLLARLDRQHFELSITPQEETLRDQLFACLCDPVGADRLAQLIGQELSAAGATDHPLLGWVQRLQQAGSRSRLARMPHGTDLVNRLVVAAAHNDVDYLAEQLADLRQAVHRPPLLLVA